MKILFISPYPIEGASARLRIYQYLPFFERAGIRFTVRPFFSGAFYKILYRKGNYARKIFYFLFASLARATDLLRAFAYDVVFVHREAYPIGPCVYEYIFKKILRKKVVFDFDDAIFLSNVSKSNKFVGALKRHSKIKHIIKLSDLVIAGNKNLEDFAARYNRAIKVMLTPVDTRLYAPALSKKPHDNAVTIGWIGSPTTSDFLHIALPYLRKLADDCPQTHFLFVGALEDPAFSSLPRLTVKKWSLKEEASFLSAMDIGIMPMPDNEWTRGKCAFKAILYMSMGMPVVCSKVGVNSEVVKDGVTGYLVTNDEAWYTRLSQLVKDASLRKTLGEAARKDCVARFSAEQYASALIAMLQKIAG
jgi:glycosyltransferase involved in cell wall biosynthesis